MSAIVTRAALYTYVRVQDDAARLARSLDLTTWSINMIGLPLALAVFTSAPDLVRLLYGERWLPAAVFLRLLLAFSVIRPLLDNATTLFIALRQVRASVIVQVTQALLLTGLGALLTWRYGAVGTAVAVVVAFSLGLLLAYGQLRRLVPLSLGDAVVVPGVCSAITILIYWALNRLFPVAALPLAASVGLKVVGTMAVFYLVMLVVRPAWLTERSRYLLGLLWPRKA
jgi:O-antigen/teichoic acid export membrane protein